MPGDLTSTNSFTVIDTSESTVFMYFNTPGATTPIGDDFISDGSGRLFSNSLERVIRGTEYVDMEKLNSLDGVFFANREKHDHRSNRKTLFFVNGEMTPEQMQEQFEKQKKML